MSEPSVYRKPDGWYWIDETWSYDEGPYPTKAKAQFAQTKYAVEALGYDSGWVYVDEETELT